MCVHRKHDKIIIICNSKIGCVYTVLNSHNTTVENVYNTLKLRSIRIRAVLLQYIQHRCEDGIIDYFRF